MNILHMDTKGLSEYDRTAEILFVTKILKSKTKKTVTHTNSDMYDQSHLLTQSPTMADTQIDKLLQFSQPANHKPSKQFFQNMTSGDINPLAIIYN